MLLGLLWKLATYVIWLCRLVFVDFCTPNTDCWCLGDYSQAIDIGTVKAVSSEAIRLLLCVLGFMTFGFGSKEFEITAERLGMNDFQSTINCPLTKA